MKKVNEMIISEITYLSNTSDEMKRFLLWLMDYENENIEREQPHSYKQDIDKNLNESVIKQLEVKDKDA